MTAHRGWAWRGQRGDTAGPAGRKDPRHCGTARVQSGFGYRHAQSGGDAGVMTWCTTAADVMRPPLTTVEQGAHVAAAAYLMKHAGATALLIRDGHTDQPIGIITQADIARAVADGKDVNSAGSMT